MLLDLSPLRKAISSFKNAMSTFEDAAFFNSLNEAQANTIKAGIIQHFEFTYEVSWKMLRRQLIEEEGTEFINTLSRKDLFRLAAKKGMITAPDAWFSYHRARNETSHMYEQKTADAVFDIARKMLPDAEELLTALEDRQ
ncbi:HI0074 family nucleotidyltransferase substrate-binding subunit [Aestuariibacter salexigens]|uniref:HI0074 family nucleotidyltransferase substrate-binding subunit n=1 Tax=Aestuariibacter salexigens TaxID=226010 RepID=UPI00047D9754|nr:HI0074 family nucleotidyltransferase substrate-binding subunit [Aestuariibacter salexigens]